MGAIRTEATTIPKKFAKGGRIDENGNMSRKHLFHPLSSPRSPMNSIQSRRKQVEKEAATGTKDVHFPPMTFRLFIVFCLRAEVLKRPLSLSFRFLDGMTLESSGAGSGKEERNEVIFGLNFSLLLIFSHVTLRK